jgi:hypothetical protein
VIRRVAPAAAVLVVLLAGAAAAQPEPVCAPGATEDAPRPLPAALLPRLREVFGLPDLPAEIALRGTVVRCVAGRVLACMTGANLPCGKADARRRIAAADAYCGQGHAGDVPAYVVGHATLYAWTCRDGEAVPVRAVAQADAQGFVATSWKALD